MSALAQVPAWFWVTLGSILALAGLVAGVWWLKGRGYHPEHRAQPGEPVELPAVVATVPVAEVDGKPPWELAHEPSAAEVAVSRAAHGYIPELDPDADDLGPGAGLTVAGYNSRLPSPALTRMKADSPAPVEPVSYGLAAAAPAPESRAVTQGWRLSDAPDHRGPGWPVNGAPLRLVPVNPALARVDLFMAFMRADHEQWLAGARERWAA